MWYWLSLFVSSLSIMMNEAREKVWMRNDAEKCTSDGKEIAIFWHVYSMTEPQITAPNGVDGGLQMCEHKSKTW